MPSCRFSLATYQLVSRTTVGSVRAVVCDVRETGVCVVKMDERNENQVTRLVLQVAALLHSCALSSGRLHKVHTNILKVQNTTRHNMHT